MNDPECEGEADIEFIVDHIRRKDGKYEFKVKFVGYPDKCNLWYFEEDLRQTMPESVEEYMRINRLGKYSSRIKSLKKKTKRFPTPQKISPIVSPIVSPIKEKLTPTIQMKEPTPVRELTPKRLTPKRTPMKELTPKRTPMKELTPKRPPMKEHTPNIPSGVDLEEGEIVEEETKPLSRRDKISHLMKMYPAESYDLISKKVAEMDFGTLKRDLYRKYKASAIKYFHERYPLITSDYVGRVYDTFTSKFEDSNINFILDQMDEHILDKMKLPSPVPDYPSFLFSDTEGNNKLLEPKFIRIKLDYLEEEIPKIQYYLPSDKKNDHRAIKEFLTDALSKKSKNAVYYIDSDDIKEVLRRRM
jgi:hypothetical protein